MHIRPAQSSELAELATIGRDAMFNDELTAFLAPYRYQHPECLRQGFLRRAKKRFYEGHLMLAAVTDARDSCWDGREKIVGYLSATSSKQDAESEKRSWFSWNCLYPRAYPGTAWSILADICLALELQLLRLEEGFIWYTRADKSLARQKWLQFQASVSERGPLDEFEEYWEVDHLSVDPSYHRRGIGSALVEYVKEIASQDRLPVVLLASDVGAPMYKKLGFVDLGPFEMGAGCYATAMVWQAPGVVDSPSAEQR